MRIPGQFILGIYRGFIGVLEKQMETTTLGLVFRVGVGWDLELET